MTSVSSSIRIRPARTEDYGQWLLLWEAYLKFYKTSIAESVTKTTWTRFMDPMEPMHCAVAEQDGVLVGIVHFIFHRSCWTTGDYVYLQDLYTTSEQRGQGVGRALIEHVYAFATAQGASRVHWLTQESNAQAQFLYNKIADKSGFIQYRKVF